MESRKEAGAGRPEQEKGVKQPKITKLHEINYMKWENKKLKITSEKRKTNYQIPNTKKLGKGGNRQESEEKKDFSKQSKTTNNIRYQI